MRLDDFLSFTLHSLLHVLESLVLAGVLDLEELLDDLLFDLDATELILDNLVGHVRDHQSDHDLDTDDNMLN